MNPNGNRCVLAYITAPDMAEARSLASLLLEARLVACANIIDGITSMYWWKGKIQSDGEVLVLAKTTERLAPELVDTVRQHHSYECPCVVTVPIEDGNPDFLKWIANETE